MKCHPVLPTFVLIALFAGAPWHCAPAEEPARRSPPPFMLIPFDAYAKHREAIGLSEEQVKEMSRIAEGMGDAARKLEGERRERTEALQEAVSQRPIDTEKAMERFRAVLQAEDEMKALQFRSGLAAQNLLSPEQAAKMQAIAAKAQGSRDGFLAGNEASAIREKLELLKGELRKRAGGELSQEAVGTLERVEQAAQAGKLDEAKRQLEGLLAQLAQQGEAHRKPTKETGEHQPSAAEVDQMVSRTKSELADASDAEKRERLQQQLAKLHAMQERLAAASDRPDKNAFKGNGDRPEKGPFKGDGENKVKGTFNKGDSETKEKASLKGDGEPREKGRQPDAQEKGAVKGEGEVKGKFDKNAENAKRPDPELRKRVESALADFQEAKTAGNRDGMEKITKSIEAMLRESERDGGAGKDGFSKDGARKESVPKEGDRKEGASKE